jgi:hypothetical protein
MNSPDNNQGLKNEVGQYATGKDFRHVFVDNMDHLYQLSFLLTADPDKAEECFVFGLEDCAKTNQVFRQWVGSWAKHTIVQKAIGALQPHPNHAVSWAPTSVSPRSYLSTVGEEHFEVERILGLEQFKRFVFVMSVLEHYSEHDCALLLGCSIQDIQRGRIQAFEQLVDDRASSARDSVADLQETNR